MRVGWQTAVVVGLLWGAAMAVLWVFAFGEPVGRSVLVWSVGGIIFGAYWWWLQNRRAERRRPPS